MSSHSSPAAADDIPDLDLDLDLDLPLYDTLSHSNYYYNQNQSIIYSQGTALDLLYGATIDSTIRRKESLPPSRAIPAEWTGALALDEPRGNAQGSAKIPAGETTSEENRASAEKTAERDPPVLEIPAGSVDSVQDKTAGEISEEPRELCKECQRTAVYSTFRGKGAGFTQLQAIQFLLENSIPKMEGIS